VGEVEDLQKPRDTLNEIESIDSGKSNNVINNNINNNNYDINVITTATEFIINQTIASRSNINSTANISDNIKLLSTFANNSIYGDLLSHHQNITINDDEPRIPEYITLTSMIFCIIIMCLGLIGNIMVRKPFLIIII
jgi:hypothetical protein